MWPLVLQCCMHPPIDRKLSYRIRPLTNVDQAVLFEMLYLSLYVPEGDPPFAREILEQPEIRRYVEAWGRTSDAGFVAVDVKGQELGAIWMRLFSKEEKGFAWIDDSTPELGVAVVASRRGEGIGPALLSALLEQAEGIHERISLSVSRDNPAIRLYKRFGFETVSDDGRSLIMVKRLAAHGADR